MLAVVSMALVSCGGSDGKSNSESKSESKKPVVEMADPPFIFSKAPDFFENVPMKGCFKVKQVSVADAEMDFESGMGKVNVSVTLEALQNVECDRIDGVFHIFNENMGDLNERYGGFLIGNVSLEPGDVTVATAKVWTSADAKDVKYVQIQNMYGGKDK